MSGKLTVVGFGPGSKGDMTLRAVEAIETADIVTGYTTYIKILKEFFLEGFMKADIQRSASAHQNVPAFFGFLHHFNYALCH